MDGQAEHAQVTAVRRFNRTVTQRIGALDDEYLDRGRPLGASRVLWELDEAGSDARALRAELDLDSGYLSRLLRSLEAEGLVEVAPDPDDRRVRTVRPTAAGRREREVLDERSDDLACSLLHPLNPTQRQRLVAAMGEVERLLTAGLVEVAVADPTSADAQACLHAYYAELDERFDTGFDVDQSLAVDPAEVTEPDGVMLLARLHGRAIGCVSLKRHGDEPGEIKRMWVDRSARGLGVGRRLLAEVEDRARRWGLAGVRLDTNRTLVEAIALYRSSGYEECEPFTAEPYAHHWFEKRLGP